MKIGIDIDGIILDFERTMRSFAELYDLLILQKKGVKNQNEFNYLKRYDWTKEEQNMFVNDYLVYATKYCTPLIPLVKEMLELLSLEGCEFVFITARGLLREETKDAVIKVFEDNNLPTDKIYWSVNDKVEKCKKLNIDVMIEDNPTTCYNLKENKIKVLYFRDKNNEIINENEYLKEVSNVGEICRYLFNINGLKHNPEDYEKILFRHKHVKRL